MSEERKVTDIEPAKKALLDRGWTIIQEAVNGSLTRYKVERPEGQRGVVWVAEDGLVVNEQWNLEACKALTSSGEMKYYDPDLVAEFNQEYWDVLDSDWE